MRQFRLSKILSLLSQNVAFSESKILSLKEDFEGGKIQACKARKMYTVLSYNFGIDARRYNTILAACKDFDADKYRYFRPIDYTEYNAYFNA